METNHTSTINTLLAIEWILLVTVMFGGQALLRLVNGDMTEHTERYFRAGHAHAGVLAGIGMILVLSLARTNLSAQGMVITWLAWVVGVVMLAGGMFYHAYLGNAGQTSTGTWIPTIGGIILGIVAIWFAVLLLRAR